MQPLSETIYRLLFPNGFSETPSNAYALLALRVFVGAAFVQHGMGKWHDLPGFAEEFSIPMWMAAAAALSQVGAAYALLVGLMTPLAAITIGANMTVAVSKLIGRGETFVNPHGHSWESAGGYAMLGFVIYLLGPGRLSIDRLLVERWSRDNRAMAMGN